MGFGVNAYLKNKEKDFRLRSDSRSWGFVVGALIILAACFLAYVLTKPAEADVSFINTPLMSMSGQLV